MLKAAKLPTEVPEGVSKDDLVKAIAFDKKRVGDDIKFVLPLRPIGTCDLSAKIPVTAFTELLK
jgi:3-dehydroquinate synthetase